MIRRQSGSGQVTGMEIRNRDNGRVRVLELRGRLDLHQTAALREAVYRELEAGHGRLLLDLGQVPFVDSSGLGTLVACLTSATTRRGQLKLLRPAPKVLDVLRITHTERLFMIFGDEDEAVRSFAES